MSIEDWLILSEEQQKGLFNILNSFIAKSSIYINKTDAQQQDLGISYERITCLEIINTQELPIKLAFSEIVELFNILISFINEIIASELTKDEIIQNQIDEDENISREKLELFLKAIYSSPFFSKLAFRLSRDPNTIFTISVHKNEFTINDLTGEPLVYPIFDLILTLKDGSNIALKLDQDELRFLSKAIEKGLSNE